MLARSITCGETMIEAHALFAMDSVAEVLEQISPEQLGPRVHHQ